MKLNKLAIAIGLAGGVLTGCGGSDGSSSTTPADFTVTAIDGYIANGVVTAFCGADYQTEYTGRTDASGVASLFTSGISLAECRVEITGDASTYDVDAPDEAWLHTMKSLPGLNAINPFTDIAVSLSEVPGNELLSEDELKNKVLELLGYDDNHDSSIILFTDFAKNADTAAGNADIAFLAQAVFDTKIKLEKQLAESDEANNTPANLAAAYAVILPQVEEFVAAKIVEIKDQGKKVNDNTIKLTITIPTLTIVDGQVNKIALANEAVQIQAEVQAKPTEPQATGGTGGTGGTAANQG